MSLVERAQAKPPRMHGTDCSVGVLLRELPADERAALVAMLGTKEHRGWSQSEIYEALTKEGHYVGQQMINKHRAENCRCFL